MDKRGWIQDIVRNTTDDGAKSVGKGSQIPKVREKSENSSKKVLTFLWTDDIMYKLTRAGHRKSTALNLENDTEQE